MVTQAEVPEVPEVDLLGAAGCGVVSVRAADHAEPERVDAHALLLDEPLLEDVADVVERREGLVRVGDRREELQAVQLLEAALLVGAAADVGAALGVALVLIHLHHGLDAAAGRGFVGGDGRAAGVRRVRT